MCSAVSAWRKRVLREPSFIYQILEAHKDAEA